MPRFISAGLAILFIAGQICCAPQARAKPAQCPITKSACELAQQRGTCSQAPQPAVEVPVKKFTAPQAFQPVAATTIPIAASQNETTFSEGWWSVPTRTIQLRL